MNAASPRALPSLLPEDAQPEGGLEGAQPEVRPRDDLGDGVEQPQVPPVPAAAEPAAVADTARPASHAENRSDSSDAGAASRLGGKRRSVALEGTLHGLNDLLLRLHQRRQSVVVQIGEFGEIHFHEGEIVHAALPPLSGVEALAALLGTRWGRARPELRGTPARLVPQTIEEPFEALLESVLRTIEADSQAERPLPVADVGDVVVERSSIWSHPLLWVALLAALIMGAMLSWAGYRSYARARRNDASGNAPAISRPAVSGPRVSPLDQPRAVSANAEEQDGNPAQAAQDPVDEVTSKAPTTVEPTTVEPTTVETSTDTKHPSSSTTSADDRQAVRLRVDRARKRKAQRSSKRARARHAANADKSPGASKATAAEQGARRASRAKPSAAKLGAAAVRPAKRKRAKVANSRSANGPSPKAASPEPANKRPKTNIGTLEQRRPSIGLID